MPAKSKAQQALFGMAYAVRRGKMKRSDVNNDVLDIADSDMSDDDIRDFASTHTKHLKDHIKESILNNHCII